MKITLCGSTKFAAEILDIHSELKKRGHTPLVLEGLEKFKHSQTFPQESRDEVAAAIRRHYQLILKSDAIVVINLDKNETRNYIGGSVLMEMGFAFVNNKAIFLLNPVPDVPYTSEIKAMRPRVINGNLSLVRPPQE